VRRARFSEKHAASDGRREVADTEHGGVRAARGRAEQAGAREMDWLGRDSGECIALFWRRRTGTWH
jgi:hypothetical protein